MSRSQLPREQLPKLVIPPTAPSTFMLFPKLPREIRNNIWAMAAAESRDIHLRFFHYEPVEQSEPPAILLATHEARSEGKRYYAACQESKLLLRDGEREATWRGCFTPDEIVGAVRRTIWVNFDVDQLVWTTAGADRLLSDLRIWARRKYGAGSLKFNFEDEMLSRIQHLKVEWGQDRTWWFWDLETTFGKSQRQYYIQDGRLRMGTCQGRIAA